MAQNRTLKLNLLADVTGFSKGLEKANKKTQSFSDRVAKFAKRAAAGFAVAAAAVSAFAIKYGKDALTMAAEDEASKAKMVKALQNVTKATDKQLAAVDKYITKSQLAYGISDTKLRSSFQKLATATGDLTKAQQLNNLAMDVAAGTGKDLDAVALALSKAYNGNLGALTKLGIPLDANIIKTKDFDAAQKVLAETFEGQAATAADTYQGKLARVQERLGELQEGLGAKLLPVAERVLTFFMDRLVPAFEEVGRGFSGDDNNGLSNKVRALARTMDDKSDAYSLGQSLRNVTDAFGQLFATLTDSKAGQSSNALVTIANNLERIANAVDAVTYSFQNLENPKAKGAGVWLLRFMRDLGKGLNSGPLGLILPGGGFDGGRANGGPVRANGTYLVGERGPELLQMGSAAGRIVSNAGMGGNTFIFQGVIDGESARRSIERVMRDSSRRTGTVNLNGGFA